MRWGNYPVWLAESAALSGLAVLAALGLPGCEGFYEPWAQVAEPGSTTATAELDGIWEGSVSPTASVSPAVTAVVWDGDLRAVSPDHDAAYAGAAAPVASGSSGSLSREPVRAYDAIGGAQGTGTLSGSYVEGRELALTVSGTSRDGELDTTYAALFERDTGLSDFVASWSQSRGGRTVTLTVDSGFRLTGSSSDGCSYSGELSLLRSDRNLYRLRLTLENCSPRNGDYTGLAFLRPDAGPGEWMALAERDTGDRFWWARLVKQ